MRISVYTIFCPNSGLPLLTGIHSSSSGQVSLFDLYIPGSGKSLFQIEKDIAGIGKLLMAACGRGAEIVTSDWKDHVKQFDLPLCKERYGAFDLQIGYPDPGNRSRARKTVAAVVERMGTCAIHQWQRVLADAAIVYEDWERTGVLHGGLLRHPQWSQRTSAGRSKCKGFNIQGINRQNHEHIGRPGGNESDLLVLFDWISADIRFAGIFAGDEVLNGSFLQSDPYTVLAERLGLAGQEGARDDCKVGLLRGINSMNTDSPVFEVFPKLGAWIDRCRVRLSESGGYLDTFLGRRFRVADKKNELSVLNGCMQGSVAHAMQLSIRRIWERMRGRLLMEGHDSLVMCCAPDRLESTIEAVAEIMLLPFQELYDAGRIASNPSFPFKVRVGRLWNGWELRETHRLSTIERAFIGKDKLQESAEEAETAPEASRPPAGVGQPEPAHTRSDINSWFGPAGV